eukprot:scaffold163200_cov19-Tisochrysis_lutea.AAC.3
MQWTGYTSRIGFCPQPPLAHQDRYIKNNVKEAGGINTLCALALALSHVLRTEGMKQYAMHADTSRIILKKQWHRHT